MKFGTIVPMIGATAGSDALDAVCASAEVNGLDSLWVVDHILLPHSIGAQYPYNLTGEWMLGTGQWWDAFSVLAYVAARTERVQLGTGVIVLPYRHPANTAKIVATIDQLSRGRLVFGLGVGWMEDEFRNLGLETFHHRGALVDEQIEVFKELWTNDPASYAGRYYQINAVSCTPRPYQQPHPPLLVGGNTDAALRRAGEACDGWFSISISPAELRERRRVMDTAAEAAGRDPATLYIQMLHGIRITDDADERATLSDYDRGQAIVGTVEQVVEELREFEAAGLTQLVGLARLPGQPNTLDATLESIAFTMQELAPRLR